MPVSSAYTTALQIATSPIYIKKNLIRPKSFTAGYVFYRIARPLLKINYAIFKVINPERPWTSQAAIRIFEKILTPQMIGFEYGSGNSTLFFARHLKHITSIEHNQGWFDIVKNKLQQRDLGNVDYHFIPPATAEETNTYTFYHDYHLTEKDFDVRKEYHAYFSFVKNYPDNHFDFIMVDGRARVECCLNAIPKLKAGGIFVLDNSDRKRYEPVFKVLAGWKCINTTTGLFDTTFWFKP
ncbi:MAG: class I SAM-dependent methyltransferase [Flavobacterium psychrophilum]|jgi:hypothetical protein|nr:class I SAM-dependent methyltransferase [Cytophaga sp.]PZR19008.1 MAG: class I SAM-dependent methyltransferase [Flavobacterium psychrophilum]